MLENTQEQCPVIAELVQIYALCFEKATTHTHTLTRALTHTLHVQHKIEEIYKRLAN